MPVRPALGGATGALSSWASGDRVRGGDASCGGSGGCTTDGARALSSSGPPCPLRGAPGVAASWAADSALIRRAVPSTELSALIRSRS